MKLFKAVFNAVFCFAVFAVLLVFGCFYLYNRDIESGAVVVEESNITEPPEQISAAQSAAETEPYQSDESTDDNISEEESSGFTISFTVLGDCILSSNDGDTREGTFIETAKSQSNYYFFEKAKPYYKNSDFVLANCEFVMSDSTLSKSDKDGTAFWFKSPTSFASILRCGGIDLVTLANNHTYDYGEQGYVDTKNALESENITWGDLNNPIYVEKNGITFGIICTNLSTENYDPMVTPVIEEVVENSDVQILYFHGGTEKEYTPEDWLVNLCHKYADMGVDLIVGSHPTYCALVRNTMARTYSIHWEISAMVPTELPKTVP